MDLKNGMAIKCNSEEEAKEFIKEAYKQGFKWVNHIDGCEEKTCWYTGCSKIYYYLESNKIKWSPMDFENYSIEYSTLKEKMKTMTKSDLKNGMVVETRNKEKGIILNEKIILKDGFVNIYDLDENLECNFALSRDGYSIDKIYKHTPNCFDDLLNFEKNMELLWERKKQPKLSKEDKQIIKKGLKKIQEECKRHKFCYGCMFDDDGACILDKIETLEVDKLFED